MPQTHVVLDTSELFDDVRLSSSSADILLRLAKQHKITLHVPKVVVAETSRHFRRKFRRAVKELAGPLTDLRNLEIDGLGLPSISRLRSLSDEEVNKHREGLIQRLADHDVHVCAVPSVSHEKLLADLLSERKPFKQEGEGYRDALIWASTVEHAVSLMQEDTLVLVTSNRKDFSGKAGGGLALDLVEDLADAKVVAEVRWCESVADAVILLAERGITPATERAPDQEIPVEARASLDELVAGAIDGYVDNLLGEEVAWDTPDGGMDYLFDVALPGDLETPTIHSIEIDSPSLTTNTYETFEDDSTVLLEADVEATIYIDGFMHKSAYLSSGPDVQGLDSDWNDHMAWVAVERRVRLNFHVRANPDTEFVEVADFVGGTDVTHTG